MRIGQIGANCPYYFWNLHVIILNLGKDIRRVYYG